MFLQGTASVYSKKVEFLWQAVLKMLDLLASKKALDEVEGTCKYSSNHAQILVTLCTAPIFTC